jgi:NAD+ synthase (glutamine-hydrolysing)
MFQNGFIKVSLNVPKNTLGQPLPNAKEMIDTAKRHPEAQIVAFPEMALTGYSLGDWVFNRELLEQKDIALDLMLKESTSQVWIVGGPLAYEDSLYNVCYVIQNKRILGIVPKMWLPRNREFYENRMFASGARFKNTPVQVTILNQTVTMGSLIFEDKIHDVSFGIEICADMWAPTSPSSDLYLAGAQMVFNLSASTFYVGKRKTRTGLVQNASLKGEGAYLFVSNGITETSSEYACCGHRLFCECGDIIEDEEKISFESETSVVDVDLMSIHFHRYSNGWFHDGMLPSVPKVEFNLIEMNPYPLTRHYNPLPFVVSDADKEDILAVLEASLVKRLKHIGISKIVLGISGGLDSSFALLLAHEAFVKYQIPTENIIALTMPGLATGETSKSLAMRLMKKLNVDARIYPIQNGVEEHFKLIGQDPKLKNITYENTQARYRTFTLMNLANKENALVLGTGDMSEIALGWSTFAGDQISMYNLNAGLPKTAIKSLVAYFGEKDANLRPECMEVTNAVITPELTGADQATEDIVGPYDQNDFVMYHIFMKGASKNRVVALLQSVYNISNDVAIVRYDNFMKRFKRSQFKRYAAPEGVKIFELSLSPRGDLRFPGDMR